MALHLRSDHSAMSEINVTPLVDVMLVLLVVFIVTAPLLVQSIPVELPKTAPATPVSSARNTSVTINAGGDVFLDGRPLDMAALKPALQALTQTAGPPTVLIQADHKVPFGRVAQVLALAQHAGIQQLSVVTSEESSK
jgi:biopolymer transport protein ExbD